jgi:endonuclease/exonuclease/phosphatase family metal-dependent hydrolase
LRSIAILQSLSTMRRYLLAIVPFAVITTTLGACRTGRNYPDAREPRYVGAGRAPFPARTGDTLTIVSFNIAFGRNVDRAIALISSDPDLARADVLLLQEMNPASSARIAEALGMGYVYYPAIYHTRADRDFGNAVLSVWPIVDDAKVILPHTSRYAETQRTATAATLLVGTDSVRVYSTHLGTLLDIGAGARREQLQAIVADAARFSRVVIGGDFNASNVAAAARDSGYSWPTERGERTTFGGRWDHILLRGLTVPAAAASGTATDVGVSDHRPVWVRAIVRAREESR